MSFSLPNPTLSLYTEGEDADAGVLNRPVNQTHDNVLALAQAIDAYRHFFVTAQATPGNTAKVEAGRAISSDGKRLLSVPSSTNSPSFGTVSASGKVRYDVLQLNDQGLLEILPGSEVNAPGDPIQNHPNFDDRKIALAIIKVDEPSTVVIDTADITDAREFITKSGAEIDSLLISETHFPAAGTTLFNLNHAYTQGGFNLLVFKNGKKLDKESAYVETSTTSVTLNDPTIAGDWVEFVLLTDGRGTAVAPAWRERLSEAAGDISEGQTTLNLANTFNVGTDQLMVFRNGKKLIVGEGFTETDSDTIEFGDGVEADDIFEFTVLHDLQGTWKRQRFDALASQTHFNLSNPYVSYSDALMVFRNGLKLSSGEHSEPGKTLVIVSQVLDADDIMEFYIAGTSRY